MVWSQDAEAQRPPLSVILPRLYLGAERDVTQELLSSLGISYVLSVSRCSPRPPFLPPCRFLRIPIDDSLWADLLPWIPQALCFIDAAMSSGGAVLVHCAAGISRSPALAVAYIMYRLEMDLDHAYRFVKERRPSISPNFNFLGQLQHFQGTLTEKSSSCDLVQQNLEGRQNQVNKELSTGGGGSGYWWAQATWTRTCSLEDSGTRPEPGTLDPTPGQSPQRIQEAAVSPGEPSNYGLKDSRPQLPSGTAALQEKRRSLSLSLTPLGSSLPPSIPKSENSTAPPGLGWDRLKVESRTESGPWREKPVDTRPASRAEPVNCSPASRVESGPYGGETRSDSPAYRPEGKEQRVLSPFSITLCRLLDWGGRLLLGALVPPVRMGRPALPYKS